ncbi:MAG: DNA polymerase III subunit beta [Bacillota bacterium]
MKFYCAQEKLGQALQIVSRGIPNRSTLPILSGIYLEYQEGALLLRTTDLEIGMEITLSDIEGEQEGAVVVSGKRLADIVRFLPQEQVAFSFDQEQNQVFLRTRRSSFQLPVLPVQEFPALPDIKSEISFKIAAGTLKEGIRKMIYATLPDDIRPYLTAVLFELTPGFIKLAATDINRLALETFPLEGIEKGGKFLVPTRALQEINRIALNENRKIEVDIAPRQIRFKTENLVFISRLVEAQFPEYEKVLPKNFQTKVVISRIDIIQALERVSLMVPSVKMNITRDKIVLATNEPEIGKAVEEIESDRIEGTDLNIGFNSRFLLEFLNAVDSEEVLMKFTGEEKPAVMEAVGLENYMYVVMPMKII